MKWVLRESVDEALQIPLPYRGTARTTLKAEDGGAEGSRTPDLLNAIQTLYQLSYDPSPNGANLRRHPALSNFLPGLEMSPGSIALRARRGSSGAS
jgi:hypothetical protein